MPHPKNRVEHICELCHKVFTEKASRGKSCFCSSECRNQFRANTKTQGTCPICNVVFTYYKKYVQVYCSPSCAMTARNLTDLNPSYHRDVSGENNPMFGKGKSGPENPMYGKTKEENPAWKGGRKVRKDGYVLIYAPDHPCATANGDGSRTYILEHRLVMERHLGRYLLPNEVVHHIDKNPSNNNIDNLRLYSSHAEHVKDAH